MEPSSKFQQMCLIGTGLMGASLSRAMKDAGLVERVIGYDSTLAACESARSLGYIDEIAPSIADATKGSDLIILAIPVAAMAAALIDIRQGCGTCISRSLLIMDLGSTKVQIAHYAEEILQEYLPCFVPAHPICGREVSGCANSQADLYAGKRVVLCPLPQTSSEHVRRARGLWASLGCTLTEMTAVEHDAAYAAVSHIPHLLAFAYIDSICRQEKESIEKNAPAEADAEMSTGKGGSETAAASQIRYSTLAGSGFRDFSRIAGSNPVMWRDILLANREQVLLQTRLFRASLCELERCLVEGEAEELEERIRSASEFRSNWGRLNNTS